MDRFFLLKPIKNRQNRDGPLFVLLKLNNLKVFFPQMEYKLQIKILSFTLPFLGLYGLVVHYRLYRYWFCFTKTFNMRYHKVYGSM